MNWSRLVMHNSKKSIISWMFRGLCRSQGCVFFNSYRRKEHDIPQISVYRWMVWIYLLTLRVKFSSSRFHENNQSSCDPFQKHESHVCDLFRCSFTYWEKLLKTVLIIQKKLLFYSVSWGLLLTRRRGNS